MENATLVVLAGAVGALVGTFISAVSNIILAIINRRSEERKQINDLVMNAALADYKLLYESSERENARTGKAITILPFDSFVVHNFLLVNALTGREHKLEKLKERLMKVDESYHDIMASRNYQMPTGERYRHQKPGD